MAPQPPPPVGRGADQDLPHVPLRVAPPGDPAPVPVGTLECALKQVLRLGAVPGREQTCHGEQARRGGTDELLEGIIAGADDFGLPGLAHHQPRIGAHIVTVIARRRRPKSWPRWSSGPMPSTTAASTSATS